MKNSGVEWIGEIPEYWEVRKIKHNATVFAGYPFDSNKFSTQKGFPLIRIRDITSGNIETFFDGDFDSSYIIKKDDLIIGMDGDFNLRWWNNQDALLNQRCCKIETNKTINKRYLFYCIPYDLENINNLAYSTTVKHLSNSDILNISIPLPPKSTQQRIASYLDKKCSKIEETIQNQQQVIEELKAYKQSLITEAVTGKIKIQNGKVCGKYESYKDSGVEWIGKIPSEWISTRVGHLYKSILGKMVCPNQLTEEHTLQKYLCAMNVHFDGVDLSEIKQMWFTPNEMNQYQVRNGDLLVVEGGAGAGGASIVYGLSENENIFIQNSIHLVKPVNTNYLPKYLYYWIYSLVKQNYIDYTCNKATIPHFTKEKLEGMPIAISDIKTQKEIIQYLDKKCTAIDTAIEQKQKLIEKLTEYKKSLIYEYVTGKKVI